MADWDIKDINLNEADRRELFYRTLELELIKTRAVADKLEYAKRRHESVESFVRDSAWLVWAALNHGKTDIAKQQLEKLMNELGLSLTTDVTFDETNDKQGEVI